LQEIVRLGYGAAPEEVALGLNAVAAPIFDAKGACVAAVAIVDTMQYLPEKVRPADAAQLIEAAREISRNLGHGRADEPAAHRAAPAPRSRRPA